MRSPMSERIAIMNRLNGVLFVRKWRFVAVLIVSSLVLLAAHFYLYGQDKSNFPDGYDALQAAPDSHKVIFENAFVRVLEVTVPPAGSTIPMHHHRWPSFFLDWDTGAGRRIFAIIAETAALEISRARNIRFIRVLGV